MTESGTLSTIVLVPMPAQKVPAELTIRSVQLDHVTKEELAVRAKMLAEWFSKYTTDDMTRMVERALKGTL